MAPARVFTLLIDIETVLLRCVEICKYGIHTVAKGMRFGLARGILSRVRLNATLGGRRTPIARVPSRWIDIEGRNRAEVLLDGTWV